MRILVSVGEYYISYLKMFISKIVTEINNGHFTN